jgi:Cu(I)/Ag(I) efflux system membrane fusion protein
MKLSSRQLFFVSVSLLTAIATAGCGKKEGTPMAQEAQSNPMHGAETVGRQLYQCSMHPNIISDKPGNCPICGMELQPVRKVNAAGIPGRGAVDLTDQQRQLVNIHTVAVKETDVDRSVRAVGVVTCDQSKVTELNSRVMGWVEKLFVDTPGAHVEAGQPLLELYSPDLYSAKQDYLLAWRNLHSAKGARGEYGAARASGADSVLQSARKRLELFGITDEQINALQTSGTAKPTMEIVAPFAGTVLQKEVVAGKMIQPTAILYRIADLSRVWVEAEVYEFELPLVKVGQQAQVTLTAYPDRTFTGKVDFIYPYLQGQTRTVKIRVVLDNPDGVLKPDMYANVELKSDLGQELVIPASALFDSGKRQYVFVQQEKGLFVPKQIDLGPKVGDDFVVRKGLAVGEQIVVEGNFLLDSESQLKAAAGGPTKMTMGDHQP